MADKRKRRRWLIVVVVLLLYPLSIGPWHWLFFNGYVSEGANEAVWKSVYYPFRYFAQKSELGSNLVYSYLGFWEDGEWH